MRCGSRAPDADVTILLILVPISLLLLGAAIWAFIWAVRGGQYDDLDTPAIDMLRDDALDAPPVRRPPSEPADHDDAD